MMATPPADPEARHGSAGATHGDCFCNFIYFRRDSAGRWRIEEM
jgi:hypothetical protein